MGEKKKILVIDDDAAVLDTTSTFLELFGYSVIQAKDGIEGISKFREHLPDLVFMDVKMPKLDGYETFFEIKHEFPQAKVIFMTAHADYSKWNEAKRKNALELIEKPYSPEELKKITARYCPK